MRKTPGANPGDPKFRLRNFGTLLCPFVSVLPEIGCPPIATFAHGMRIQPRAIIQIRHVPSPSRPTSSW